MTERPEVARSLDNYEVILIDSEISMPVEQDRPFTGVVCYSGRREE